MIELKNLLPISILFSFLLFQTSCAKEDINQSITEEEAVEIIEASVQENSGGITTTVEDASKELVTTSSASNTSGICDSTFTENFDFDYNGQFIQTSYTSDITYNFTCNNFNLPEGASLSGSSNFDYNSNKLETAGDATFSASAIGFLPNSSTITMNGNYVRSGAIVLNLSEQKNVNSLLNIELTDILVSKTDYTIQDGSGIFSLTGTVSNSPFTIEGEIIFNGGGTITLIINGNTYEIDL